MFIGLTLLTWVATTSAAPRWYWDDRFSQEEKAGLIDWVQHSLDGMSVLLGDSSVTYHVHFLRHRRGGEPVPWAETNKGRGRRVFFHVDTRYPWTAFKQDWTAPHELSHLIFPYLGEDSRWFAEGIASYLQYQIMYAGNVLSWEQAMGRYRNSFGDAASESRARDTSIVEQSRRGASGSYVRLYWGGAAYFLHADRELFLARRMRLTDVVRMYAQCCYTAWGVDADDMIREFDRLSGSSVFADTYTRTVARPGFPDTAEALDWLRENPPPRRSVMDPSLKAWAPAEASGARTQRVKKDAKLKAIQGNRS